MKREIFPDFQAVGKMSDKRTLSDIHIIRQARRSRANYDDKAPPWVRLNHGPIRPRRAIRRRNSRRRSAGAGPVAAPGGGRAARRARFARPTAVGTGVSVLGAAAETASRRADASSDAAFLAAPPCFVGSNSSRRSAVRRALRQRLACERPPPAPVWRAIARFFRAARRRASFAQRGADAPTSPPGACIAVAAVWGALRRVDEPSLRKAADLLELPRDRDLEAWPGGCGLSAQGQESPLTAAARAGSATLQSAGRRGAR